MVLDIKTVTNILWTNLNTGYSVNLAGGVPTDGYMVGGYVPSLVIPEDARTPLADTDAWLEGHASYLTVFGDAEPLYYAGIWADSDTDIVYVDISRNVPDLYTALAIAHAHGELAIWDVANKVEIRTEVPSVRDTTQSV